MWRLTLIGALLTSLYASNLWAQESAVTRALSFREFLEGSYPADKLGKSPDRGDEVCTLHADLDSVAFVFGVDPYSDVRSWQDLNGHKFLRATTVNSSRWRDTVVGRVIGVACNGHRGPIAHAILVDVGGKILALDAAPDRGEAALRAWTAGKLGPQMVLQTPYLMVGQTLRLVARASPDDRDSAGNSGNFPSRAWAVRTETDPMDDSKTIYMHRVAESVSPAYGASPILVIQCSAKRTSIYVVTDVVTESVTSRPDYSAVRLRLDGAPPQSEEWLESRSGASLFAPRAIPLARQLATAKQLLFEFREFRGPVVVATFILDGIREPLGRVASACDWQFE